METTMLIQMSPETLGEMIEEAVRRAIGNRKIGSRKSEDVLLTIDEAAAKLNLVPNTVRTKINRGELKAVKTGQKWLIRQSAIDEYLMACEGRQPLSKKDIESRAATYVALNKVRYGKVR